MKYKLNHETEIIEKGEQFDKKRCTGNFEMTFFGNLDNDVDKLFLKDLTSLIEKYELKPKSSISERAIAQLREFRRVEKEKENVQS